MANLNFQATDNRTIILMGDVAGIVEKGGTIIISKHDRAKRFARYLNNNKRNMVLAGGSLLATVLIGAPIALAVAAGGKVVMFAGKSIVQGFRKWRKGKKYRKMKNKSGLTAGEDLIWKRDNGYLVYNTEFGEQLLDDVRYLLDHQGMTDIYNAFANLDDDFMIFNKFSPGTFPPREWEFSTFGTKQKDVNIPTHKEIETLITSSDKAVKLWEACCRIQYRYQQVAEAVEMLQEFVEYITASISVFDAGSVPKSKQLWSLITENGKKDADEVLELLNNVVNEKGIRKHFGRRLFSRKKDYRAWAYGQLPDYIKQQSKGLTKAVVKKADPNKYKQILSNIPSNSVKEFVGFDPDDVSDRDAWVEYAFGMSIDVAGGIIENQFASLDEKVSTFTSVLQGGGGKFFQAEAGIQAAVEAAATVVVEAVNKAWEEYQIETGKTFSITKGHHQQSIASRIGILRNMANEQAQDYVDIIDGWREAYEKCNSAVTPEAAAEALLLFHKCEGQYYRNKTGQMQQEAVFAVNQLVDLANGFTASAAEAVENFLKADNENYVKGIGAYYYGSFAKAVNNLGYTITDQTVAAQSKDAPVKRINGSDLMQEVFSDKGLFISNLLSVDPRVKKNGIPGLQQWSMGMPTKSEWQNDTKDMRSDFWGRSKSAQAIKRVDQHLDNLHRTLDKAMANRSLRLILNELSTWTSLKLKKYKMRDINQLSSTYPKASTVMNLSGAIDRMLKAH